MTNIFYRISFFFISFFNNSDFFSHLTNFQFFFPGFHSFAQYTGHGDRKVLICRGYRFYRHGETNTRIYWRCSGYKRFKCPNRAITKMIDGYEMVKLRTTIHNHPATDAIDFQ